MVDLSALHAWVARRLGSGRLLTACGLIALATAFAVAAALRFAASVPFEDVVYGERRSPAIAALLESLGRERTAVVVYLLERSWTALVAATGLTPLFVWILGSTAVHAAARIAGSRAAFLPLFILFGYASGLARIPADLASLALPAVAGLVGGLTTAALGLVAWSALQQHHGLPPQRALTTLVIAVALFYVVPLALIVAAVVAILVAAIVLEYVPPL